jgi:hypothetical protein
MAIHLPIEGVSSAYNYCTTYPDHLVRISKNIGAMIGLTMPIGIFGLKTFLGGKEIQCAI